MKKQGFSITGIIVSIGLIALIVWGIDYIVTKDFVLVRAPISGTINNEIVATTTPPQATSTQTVATSTPTKTTPVKVTTTTTTLPASSNLTVTLTDKGFSPATLTIKKGQTVTFINNSSEKMWVSANPFPSAADYPAFNEKSGVASGSSWDFTFDKTGVWFYHDHYHPALGAKIVVNAK